MSNLFFKKIYLLITLLLCFVGQAMANSGKYNARVKASISQTGAGTVYVENAEGGFAETSTGGNASDKKNEKVNVEIQARANEGWEFSEWTWKTNPSNYGTFVNNSQTNADATVSVQVSGSNGGYVDYEVIANFKQLPKFYFSGTAYVSTGSSGMGTASASPATGSAYGEHWNSTSCTASPISFTATPNSSSDFVGWSETDGGTIISSENPYKPNFTSSSQSSGSPANKVLYANFAKQKCATPSLVQNGTSVTLSCSKPTSGVIIYYTTDGSTPSDTNGTGVASGTSITSSYGTTIKAIAIATNGSFNPSDIATLVVSERPSGTGTASDPYLLSTSTHLKNFQELVDDGKASAYFKVTADFDAPTDYKSPTTPFTGNFDGDFHVISGLNSALVSTATGATIRNVIVDNVAISGNTVGAIANTAGGSARIYNCGVLATNTTSLQKGHSKEIYNKTYTSSSNISGTTAGSIVGEINGNARVLNCYSYADVNGSTRGGGIVGRASGTWSNATAGTGNFVMNCMYYGQVTGGTRSAIVNASVGTTYSIYSYFRYKSFANVNNLTQNGAIAAAEDMWLRRFKFYQAGVTNHRDLAAVYCFNNASRVSEIAQWYINDDIAPWPILRKAEAQKSILGRTIPNTGNANEGNLITNGKNLTDETTGDVIDSDVTRHYNMTLGDNKGYLSVTFNIGSNSYTEQLPITDMDYEHYDYTWGKVVLPFINEFDDYDSKIATWNSNYDNVCTGWEITSVSGGTAGTLSDYNFADRDCTAKDIYNATDNPIIFAQGGNYIVPYGVTAITVKAHFAKAFYLSDGTYDRAAGGDNTCGGNRPTTYHGKTVYTSIANAWNAMTNKKTLPHDQAIVLVGNYHYTTNESKNYTDRGCTIISVDEDKDQQPDFGWYTSVADYRQEWMPIRWDFVPIVGAGMLQIYGSMPPGLAIPIAKGWLELTETTLCRTFEFESNDGGRTSGDNGKGNNAYILNGGWFQQVVRSFTNYSDNQKLSYFKIGGSAFIKEFFPGNHSNSGATYNMVPVIVTGGEVEQCYMTGMRNQSKIVANTNARFYCSGGKIGKYLSVYMEYPISNATMKVDHARIGRFFGGGTTGKAALSGNIDVVMNNSNVDFFCGGPEFGDMASDRTVKVSTSGSIFGEYYGAGFGGTALTRIANGDGQKNPYSVTARGRLNYNESEGGFEVSYEMEALLNGGGSDLYRYYDYRADLSFATTGDVTTTANNCLFLNNFYGGGCQGKVGGKITSTLTNCDVTGSAFGGGYKAAATTIDVLPGTDYAWQKWDGTYKAFSDPVYPDPVVFTWASGPNGTSNEQKKELYTNADMTQMGRVTGDISITINGGTVGVDVYGGGNESPSDQETNVEINQGATITGNVYGGANQADVGGNTIVDFIAGTADNVFGANNQSGTKDGTVTVNINQTTEKNVTINNVYGGGNLAAYTAPASPASPAVNVTAGTVNHDVYGGGFGTTAVVTGTPTVTIDGGAVNGSVYGGGALANVTGHTYVNLNGGEVGEDVFGGGKGELNDDGTAKTYADVSGATHVTANGTTLKFPENGIDQAVNHNIYGGGNLACRVNASNVTINAGLLPAGFLEGSDDSAWGKWIAAVKEQDDNVMQGSVFGGGYGVNTTVTTTATVNVNVPAGATNKAMVDVVGGGYNGYVLNKTDVTVAGASEIYKVYGGGLGSYDGYNTAPTTNRTGTAINTFTMKETIGSVGEGKVGDGTNVTINGGHIYNNVYGGGAGLKYDADGTSYLNVAEVFGKSNVTIDAIAGWPDESTYAYRGSIYGGGALGLVNDEIMVKVMSGTMAGAEIFAGSLGEKGHLDKAKVTTPASVTTLANATSGALQGYFNIYGGCDMAQMGTTENHVNTNVNILYGTFSGKIFGAGKGLESEEISSGVWEEYIDYGKVFGNTTIVIDAPNVVLGQEAGITKGDDGRKNVIVDETKVIKIYGGGALGLVEGTINPVILKSGTLYGEVFGGSLGELGHPNKAKISLTPGTYLGVKTEASTTNLVDGKPAPLNGNINIFGGCDMAVVEGNTEINITHGTFIGEMFGGGKGVATVFEGEGDAKHDIYADHGKVVGETKIIYNNDGTFNGNVYGGGALGSVIPATTPTDGYTTEIYLKKGELNGHVFGGGYGEKTNVDKAKVIGNTYITTRYMDDPELDVLRGDMNHIYGGGDMAMVDGDTNLDFTRGEFNGEIFGGGNGIKEEPGTDIGEEKYLDFGKVTGTTHVVIDGGKLGTPENKRTGDDPDNDEMIHIYGGGALGLVGGIDIKVMSGEHYGEVFGGSLGEYGHPDKAIVDGDSFVSTVANSNSDPLTGDISFYGGCNQSQVTGNSSVTITYGEFTGNVFGGGKGVKGSDVYGKIGRDASVLIIGGDSRADVYGGCALGVVEGNTTVDLAGGAVKDVYGGGLGDASTAAYVNGNATVTLNGSTVDGATNDCKVYGSIFGCNNVNGTPKGNAYVHIVKTEPRVGQVAFDPGHPEVSNSYAVAAVYGGGNNAAYIPDFTKDGVDGHTRVYVKDCENSIEYVYGGGNAAPVPATLVTIDGANSINYVFGGGNGKGDGNPGADVGYLGYYSKGSREEYGAGTATTIINGGTITNVYGGSNTLGYIRTKASVTVEQNSSCTLNVANIFAAGNEADMFCDGVINIGCVDRDMEQIFGGSNNANIKGNIMLNLTNGKFHQVFGGNNEGGNIEGTITVNIDETGCKPVEIDELYCCGNQAAYSVYGYNSDGTPKESGERVAAKDPTINIISFTRIGSIFGGGLGAKAAVYGNTNININPIPGKFAAAMPTNEKYEVTNNNDGNSQSEQALPDSKWYTTSNCGIIGNVYGGGSEAMVYGNTNITIGSEAHNSHVTGGAELMAKTYDVGVNITGNIYGGGKKAKVTGDTNVKVGK